jgi:hypothetical protein
MATAYIALAYATMARGKLLVAFVGDKEFAFYFNHFFSMFRDNTLTSYLSLGTK